jgi:hypothetical protein
VQIRRGPATVTGERISASAEGGVTGPDESFRDWEGLESVYISQKPGDLLSG